MLKLVSHLKKYFIGNDRFGKNRCLLSLPKFLDDSNLVSFNKYRFEAKNRQFEIFIA